MSDDGDERFSEYGSDDGSDQEVASSFSLEEEVSFHAFSLDSLRALSWHACLRFLNRYNTWYLAKWQHALLFDQHLRYGLALKYLLSCGSPYLGAADCQSSVYLCYLIGEFAVDLDSICMDDVLLHRWSAERMPSPAEVESLVPKARMRPLVRCLSALVHAPCWSVFGLFDRSESVEARLQFFRHEYHESMEFAWQNEDPTVRPLSPPDSDEGIYRSLSPYSSASEVEEELSCFPPLPVSITSVSENVTLMKESLLTNSVISENLTLVPTVVIPTVFEGSRQLPPQPLNQVKCCECDQWKPKSEFAGAQLKKRVDSRKCGACVVLSRPPVSHGV
jgi:hypothetical protein